MRVGDLVCYRSAVESPNMEAIYVEWGQGLVTGVYINERTVEVIWPNKGWTTRTISVGYLERVIK